MIKYTHTRTRAPEGRKTAASFRSIFATRISSSAVVGSSIFCSSPTGAKAMASRMAWEGWVLVSEKKSADAAAMGRESKW